MYISRFTHQIIKRLVKSLAPPSPNSNAHLFTRVYTTLFGNALHPHPADCSARLVKTITFNLQPFLRLLQVTMHRYA